MNEVSSQEIRQSPPKTIFLAATIVIFFLSLSVADSVRFVPASLDGTSIETESTSVIDTKPIESVALSDLPQLGDDANEGFLKPIIETVLPVRIKITAIDMNLKVQNIESKDVEKLDHALAAGPVRYMDSAKLGGSGNMLVFAHSSHLPIVRNKMYKAFNRIPELKEGDSITVVGEDGKEYLYAVSSVRKTDASDTVIDLSPTQGTKLTLSTCDTVTSKNSRFVVEADFVGTVGE